MSLYPSVNNNMSNLDGGTFFIKSLLSPNLFLDLNSKNKVIVDIFNNKESQKWILKGSPVSAGNYAIINAEKNSPITIHSDFWGVKYAVVKPSNGGDLDLDCYCWRYDSVKQMIEISPAPFKTKKRVVLDVKGASTKPLTEMIVYEENDGPNQQFQFVAVVAQASPQQQSTMQTQQAKSPSIPVEEVQQQNYQLPAEQIRTLHHVESASPLVNQQQQQSTPSHKPKLHFNVSLKPEILQALEASSKVQQMSQSLSKQPSHAQPSHFYTFDVGLERGEIERIQGEMNKENLLAEEIQKRARTRSHTGKQLPPPPRINTEQKQQPAPSSQQAASSTSSSFTQQQTQQSQQPQSPFDPFSGIPVYNPSSFYGGNPNVLVPPSYPQYQSPYMQAPPPDPNRHA